jgi:hypothetical protein
MRGALMDATLPVVMRRTCVCPSRLLAAAVNCPVMGTGKVVVGVSVTSARTGHDLKKLLINLRSKYSIFKSAT